LSHNAIAEKRFQDAAQYYWVLATESLSLVTKMGSKASKDDKKYLKSFEEYSKLAEIYQAYNLINKYIEESYRQVINSPLYYESVFNASRFLVNNLGHRAPQGINKVYIYQTLATLGYKFEAYKTARLGYEVLSSMKVPDHMMEEIEVEALKIRSKPFQDKDGFAFNCNRCMNIQPLVNQKGDFCVNCGAPVVRNFGSFDTLPLVEFVPEGNIPIAKAIELLK
jgi:intraflagellar transport protein 122